MMEMLAIVNVSNVMRYNILVKIVFTGLFSDTTGSPADICHY